MNERMINCVGFITPNGIIIKLTKLLMNDWTNELGSSMINSFMEFFLADYQ